MGIKKVLLILAALAFLINEAHAALYFEQEVHVTEKGFGESHAAQKDYDFKRKVYVDGDLLVFQIEEGGALQKEYGFDFKKNLYYESDPKGEYYKLFDLEILNKAFDKMSHSAPTRSSSRRGIVRDLSEAVLEGRTDYPVDIRKGFASKDLGGYRAQQYSLRTGPGSFLMNPFGWYLKAEIWASTETPGFDEYKETVAKLRQKASFYKIKYNRVSDFIVALSVLEAFPLRIDLEARRRFGLTTSKQTTREVTAFISTAPIEPEKILYLKEEGRFSWDVVYSEGTHFGKDVTLKRGKDFDPRKHLPWLLVPVLFLIWFAWRKYAHFRSVRAKMQGAHLRHCPHCKARIEVFYLVCPKCNRPVKEWMGGAL